MEPLLEVGSRKDSLKSGFSLEEKYADEDKTSFGTILSYIWSDL